MACPHRVSAYELPSVCPAQRHVVWTVLGQASWGSLALRKGSFLWSLPLSNWSFGSGAPFSNQRRHPYSASGSPRPHHLWDTSHALSQACFGQHLYFPFCLFSHLDPGPLVIPTCSIYSAQQESGFSVFSQMFPVQLMHLLLQLCIASSF